MDLKLQINHIYSFLGETIVYFNEIHENVFLIAMFSGLFFFIEFRIKSHEKGIVFIYDKKMRKPKAEFQIQLREHEQISEFYFENPIDNSSFMEFLCISSLGRVFKICKGFFIYEIII